MIEINSIKHEYTDFVLDVKNVSFNDNKIIGLIGENGSGKTTLMDLLSQRINANHTFDVKKYDLNNIMYIPSNLTPFGYLTVQEFCELILKFSKNEIATDILINKLGLENKVHTRISKLSEGMKKKLSLINLFIDCYSLVILDEPFNSIDLKYTFELKAILRQISKNSTILISSHIVDSLIDICDEFILLDNGRVKKQFYNSKNKKQIEDEIFEERNKFMV